MTPLDDLFSTDESRAESQFEKVVTLNPAEISDFPNHPFKVKQDDAMAEMVESVRKYGVLVPALVRPKENGGYEMVAGHRRKFAAALAELTEIPCTSRLGVLSNYIDYESFGRDIRFDESGVFADHGYVRSNGGRFVDIYDGKVENIPEEYRNINSFRQRFHCNIGTHTSSFKDFSKRFRFFMHCRFTSTYNCT